ncbi:hypothetical protein [Sandaracinobacteroides hominis]|uniref:hypothetical protein n=1 Tax=Sandaracinobacteroides hominis TaxID=2780086 RepID=UPI0018F719D6|nr:hypothetical protein [Sandaracinobacteroides hominis]
MNTDAALADQKEIASTWRRLHWTWYSYFYVFSLLAIMLSTLIAAKPALLGWSDDVYQFLAWVLAVVTGALTLFRPNERAVRYRQAWMTLSIAIARFESIDRIEFETVLDAREEGEKQVHQISG